MTTVEPTLIPIGMVSVFNNSKIQWGSHAVPIVCTNAATAARLIIVVSNTSQTQNTH